MLESDVVDTIARLNLRIEAFEEQKRDLLLSPPQSPCFDHLLIREVAEIEKKIKELEAERNLKKIEIQSQDLILAIDHNDTELKIDRLIIGNGIAGTMLYDELPQDYRNSRSNIEGVPNVLVIADPSHQQQWQKHQDALMGQVESLHLPAAFTHFPSEYSAALRDADIDMKSNPFHYTRGIDFARALWATQIDLGMKTLPARMTEIKQDSNAKYPYQVTIDIEGKSKTIHAKHIDICTGFGQSRKLENKPFTHYSLKTEMPAQVDQELQTKLMDQNALIYSADVGYPALKGDVVVYGGGAMSGAIVADMIYRSEPDVSVKCWVSASVKDLIDTKNTNRMNERILDTELAQTLPILKIGILKTVEQLANGKLKLTFIHSPPRGETGPIANQIDRVEKDKETVIECDQLVVGIGSENKLTPLFKDIQFEPYYSSSKHGGNIPIGTRSKDGGIMTWGATGKAGFGLRGDDYDQFLHEQENYVKTLPLESRGSSTILSARHAIREGAQSARREKSGIFPNRDQSKTPHDINNITELDLIHKLNKILQKVSPNNNPSFNLDKSRILAAEIIKERSSNPEGFSLDKILLLTQSAAIRKEMKKMFYTATQLNAIKKRKEKKSDPRTAITHLRQQRTDEKVKTSIKTEHTPSTKRSKLK